MCSGQLIMRPVAVLWSAYITRPVAVAAGSEGSQNFQWQDAVVWAGSQGRAAILVLRQGRLGRMVLLDCGLDRAGFGVGMLGSECLRCAGYRRWPYAFSEGQGREMVPARSFVLGVWSCESYVFGTCSEMSK